MKLDDFFEMSYFINLDERKDRLESIDKEFYKINFYPKRFSAVKHENGAIGCYLSHLEILRRARDENKNVLIFEDDVFFTDEHNCRKDIEDALDELYEIPWDMAYFGGNVLRPFFQTTRHWGRLSHCQSTHMYSISKNFLSPLVDFLEKNSPEITHLCLDQLYADYIVPNCKAYMIIPMLAIQKSDFSTIEKRGTTYEIPIQRYDHFLVRNEKL